MKVGAPAGARELAYAEITSDFTRVGATAGIDVTGLSVTFTAPTRPVRIEVSAPWCNNSVDQEYIWLTVTDASNNVQAGAQTACHVAKAGGANGLFINRKMTALTPGTSYTFKVRLIVNSGTVVIVAGSAAASIRAVEVDT